MDTSEKAPNWSFTTFFVFTYENICIIITKSENTTNYEIDINQYTIHLFKVWKGELCWLKSSITDGQENLRHVCKRTEAKIILGTLDISGSSLKLGVWECWWQSVCFPFSSKWGSDHFLKGCQTLVAIRRCSWSALVETHLWILICQLLSPPPLTYSWALRSGDWVWVVGATHQPKLFSRRQKNISEFM